MRHDDELWERIRAEGGRVTEQLRAVYEALAALNTHPTAAELYEMVHKRVPEMSQGTVYRNLKRLKELGYVLELDYGPGPSHYDACVSPHYHVRCLRCQRVADIDCDIVECIADAQKASGEWLIEGERVEFVGLCPECRDDHEVETHQEGLNDGPEGQSH
ncbi:MAG: Fur family transcriptional regulator [Armatimonadota bacterium]